ncbi:MAG: hypothetical protein KUG73_07070 [Pseudomonadales bacterium]|nr:hypothetical protein [Pseudomonadales bacterium]
MPTDTIQLISAYGHLSDAHKTSIFLLISDDTFVSQLTLFVEKIWGETGDCVYVRGFVLDLLNGLLIEVLLGQDVFIVNNSLSVFGCCKQIFSPAGPLLDEVVEQLRELILLFQKTKMSTTLQGRTNTEIVVQWREPPNPQRCDKHYSNVALLPTNVNGDPVSVSEEHRVEDGYVHKLANEVVLSHTDFKLNGPVPLHWTRHYRSSYSGGWSCIANEALHVSQGWVNYFREDGVIVSFELPPIGKYSTNVTCGLILQRVFYSVFVIKGEGDTRRVFSGLYSTTLPSGAASEKSINSCFEETIPITQFENQYSEGWQFDYKSLAHGHHQLVGVKCGWGHDLAIEWNKSGFITRIVNKSDGKVLAQYDWDNTCLQSAVSDTKRRWQYAYLSNDPTLISTMTYPNGLDVQWKYDVKGQVQTSALEKHALQRVVLSQSQLKSESTYSYDKNHLLTSYADVEKNVTQYRYNEKGMLTAFIDPAGGGFSLSYDGQGRLREVTNALGASWSCEYNKKGDIEVFVDPEGVAYRINCVAGRPVSMSVDIESDAEASALSVQRYWQWDVCANLIMDSANGCLNQATYDAYGKLMQLADRGQEVVSFDYDPQNQLQKVSANGSTQLALMYHGSGMMSQIAKYSGQCVDLQFDDYGRLLDWKETVVSEKYTKTLSIQYDSQGRVTRLDYTGKNTDSLQFQYEKGPFPEACIDASGEESSLQFSEEGLLLNCDEQKATWQYDACGRQVYCFNNKQEVKTQYDALGRVQKHLEGNKVIQCTYQLGGQLAQYQSPLGKVEHAYNALGLRVSSAHSNGYVVTYRYSTLGMLERIEINDNAVLEYVRDAAGVELYRKQGAYQCAGDTSAARWVDDCFDRKLEEVTENIRLQPDSKNQPELIANLMFVLQLDRLDFPPLLQRCVKKLQDNGNPMRGIAKIPESSQIENGIVVHHPVSGEVLLVIYQNQVYFYENNCDPEWRDWNGNDVTLSGIRVAREYLPTKPLGDIDIKGVMKEPRGGMLWGFVTDGVASTVMNAVSITHKSKII